MTTFLIFMIICSPFAAIATILAKSAVPGILTVILCALLAWLLELE